MRLVAFGFQVVSNGRLKTRKRHIERIGGRAMPRKPNGARIAVARKAIELRTAGEVESEKASGFVVRLAGGIVARSPKNLHIDRAAHRDELRVTAGNEQHEQRVDRRF